MIKYVKGDLFSVKSGIIAHGVNTKGAFGSGVAYTMSVTYPEVRERYLEKHRCDGWQLGDVQVTDLNNGLFIANCATQDDYGLGKVHANYEAIRVCMEKLKRFAKMRNLTISIPRIGAGLAGGSWETIEQILKEVFDDWDVIAYTP